ncbi:MAG TPA: hypothetical protein VF541_18550, partial [Longimicrobium sp.]
MSSFAQAGDLLRVGWMITLVPCRTTLGRGALAALLGWTVASTATAQTGLLPLPAASGEDVVALVAAAQRLSAERRWGDAAAAWRRVVAANPTQGRSHYLLAGAELAAGDTVAALGSLARFIELGGGAPAESSAFGPDTPGGAAYQVARIHALQGRREAALEWLARALALRYRARTALWGDTAFAALRGDARFARLAGRSPGPEPGRVEGWRADIAFLQEELERLHPAPYAKVSREAFTAAARRLMDSVPVLSDAGVALGIQRLLSRVGDGHTGVPTEGVPAWRGTLPLQFESFADSIFVVAADSAHAALVGRRVVAVDGHPVEQVVRALDAIASRDNSLGVLRNRGRHLRYPRILHELGVAERADGVRLTVQDDAGARRTIDVSAGPVPAAYDRITGHPAWVALYAQGPAAPLYLRDRRTPYWFTYVPGQRLLYVGFNSVVEMPADPFAGFVRRLLRTVDSAAVDRVVVDLRWNNGGNSLMLPPLVQGLARSRVNRPGRLFVVTSRYTYSAAMNLAAFLERNTDAVFVGEPTPSSPNWTGESNIFFLPRSGTPVSISNVYWQSSWPFDARTWIAPGL